MLPGSCLSDGCFRAGKWQGHERGDFPDAPVLLHRVSAQITRSVQADPTHTSPVQERGTSRCVRALQSWGGMAMQSFTSDVH